MKESRRHLEKDKQTLSKQKLEAVVGEAKKSSKGKSSRASSRDDSYERLKQATKRVKDQLKQLQKGTKIETSGAENSSLRHNTTRQPPSARSSTSKKKSIQNSLRNSSMSSKRSDMLNKSARSFHSSKLTRSVSTKRL